MHFFCWYFFQTGCSWYVVPERSACPVLLGAETCTMRGGAACEKDDQKADANVDYNLDSVKKPLAHFLTADSDLFSPPLSP